MVSFVEFYFILFFCFYYCTSANALFSLFVPLIKFNWASSFFSLFLFSMSTHVWLKLMSSKVQVWRNIEQNLRKLFSRNFIKKNYFEPLWRKYFSRLNKANVENQLKTLEKHPQRNEFRSDRQVIFYNSLTVVCVKCTMNVFFILSTPPIFFITTTIK